MWGILEKSAAQLGNQVYVVSTSYEGLAEPQWLTKPAINHHKGILA